MTKSCEGPHCGATRFRATPDLGDAVACDCSIYGKVGAIIVRIEEAAFEFDTPLDDLGLYTFNRYFPQHSFCGTCGIHTLNRPRSRPNLWVVNAPCLSGMDTDAIESRAIVVSQLD